MKWQIQKQRKQSRETNNSLVIKQSQNLHSFLQAYPLSLLQIWSPQVEEVTYMKTRLTIKLTQLFLRTSFKEMKQTDPGVED